MRLPQSILRSFFVRTIHFLSIARVLLLLGMVPVSTSAANAQLVFTPTDLRFGSVLVGQTETLAAAVSNTGQASVTITAVAVSNAEFTTSGLTLPLALAAGQSVEFSVGFTPTSTKYAGGTVKLISNARNATLQVAGSGENGEVVTANPASVSFGQVTIGSTSTVSVVVSNAASHKVMLSSLQSTGAGFSVSGPTFPLTLNAGQSITLMAAFAPIGRHQRRKPVYFRPRPGHTSERNR